LDDVGMSDFLQDVDLSSDSLDVTFVLDAVFLQNLNGNFLTGNGVRADSRLSKCSVSK